MIIFNTNVFCESLLRLPIYRVSSYSSNTNNFNKILAKESDIYDNLINIASTNFVGQVSIGTPAQLFSVNFDMGSTDLWIPSSKCSSDCVGMNKYDALSSRTYIPNGENFTIQFDDGSSVSGVLSIDKVLISNIEIINQTFAECTSIIGIRGAVNDGVLGLAYPNSTTVNDTSVFYNMWTRGLIPKPIFSFYLNPDENSSYAGELIFGNLDSTLYTGSITYVPVVINRYWEFQMDSIYVGSTIINSSLYVTIDTGTTFIIGPATPIDALNIALGGTYDSYAKMYTVNCTTNSLSSYPNVTFIIGGEKFTLTPLQYILILRGEGNNYVCYTIFAPLDMFDSNGNLYWILGDYFLYRFYSIFDLTNNQIGLATSISYNWTQYVDPTLFNTTFQTSKAIQMKIFVNKTFINIILIIIKVFKEFYY